MSLTTPPRRRRPVSPLSRALSVTLAVLAVLTGAFAGVSYAKPSTTVDVKSIDPLCVRVEVRSVGWFGSNENRSHADYCIVADSVRHDFEGLSPKPA